MKRRRLGMGAVGALVAAGLAVGLWTGAGAGRSSARLSLGHFAGYVWRGDVRTMHARWQVPQIAAASRQGWASNWIGVRGLGGSRRYPFIQVGTEESRAITDKLLGQRDSYAAFWSDTVRRFHPIWLFVVSPGDEIRATLTHTARRWLVSITDVTSDAHARFFTAEEGDDAFGTAQWLAEDVAKNAQGDPLPYPHTSTIRFDQLAVNGSDPRDEDVESVWMSLPMGDLAPTPLTDDSFAVVPATLSESARRFLAIAARHDQASSTFYPQLARWATTLNRSEISKACVTLIATLRKEQQALASHDWPAAARPLINALAASDQTLIGRAREITAVSSKPQAAATKAAFRRTEFHGASIGRAVLRALHAPGINPG